MDQRMMVNALRQSPDMMQATGDQAKSYQCKGEAVSARNAFHAANPNASPDELKNVYDDAFSSCMRM